MNKLNLANIFIIILVFSIQNANGSPQYFHFDENNKHFTVKTKMLEMSIEGGAIVYVKDKASHEILIDTKSSENFPKIDPRLFIGFTSKNPQGNHYHRIPRILSNISYIINENKAKLTYSPLYFFGYEHSGVLSYDITVNEPIGDICIQIIGIETDTSQKRKPFTLDLPIMNFKKKSVIIGSGAKYSRNDPETRDRTSYRSLGLYSPSMIVAEGSSSCLACWAENDESDRNLSNEHIAVWHQPNYSHIILHTSKDPTKENDFKIISPQWRIGTYSNWLEAARRWRERFEHCTMAKPLWENRAEWVRRIHAVHVERHYSKKSDYTQLANIVSPENLLYFLWNGNTIVLLGDHTLTAGIAKPQIDELKLIKHYRWRLLLYHPWNLYYSEKGTNDRLNKLKSNGVLQKDYQFNPDYEGNPNSWYHYWSNINAIYSKSNYSYIIHPGSSKFKKYIVRNYRNWCEKYQADGSYFDVLGANMIANFTSDRKVIEGQDYATGEKNALVLLNKELPDLPIMSEYLNTGIIPHVFYTWEGYTHVTQNVYAKSKINHPLRTALIGSYVWSQEQSPRDQAEFNHEASALLGALPTLSLVGDYKVSREKALYSQKRCKLFCEEELFNDLPPKWDPEALAYYRSKSGNWFKFKKLGENRYAYIEELPSGGERIRLTNF